MNDSGKLYDLYDSLIKAWNERDAVSFAKLFQGKGEIVGFDGTRVVGQKEIQVHLEDVFSKHQTPPYSGVPERLQSLKTGAVMLAAKAGMKTDGSDDFNPKLWAEQSLIAVKTRVGWRIALFSNTPAELSGDKERQDAFVRDYHASVSERKAQDYARRKR